MEEIDYGKLKMEDLVQVLKDINQDVVKSALDNLVSEAVKSRTDTLHTMLCNKDHGTREGSCAYHAELDDFTAPIHRHWVNVARTYPVKYNVQVEVFDKILGEVCNIQRLLDCTFKSISIEAPGVIVDLLSKAYCSQPGLGTSEERQLDSSTQP